MSEMMVQQEGTIYTFKEDITRNVVIDEFVVGLDSFDLTALVDDGLISSMWQIPVTQNEDGTVTFDFSEWGYGTVTFPPLPEGVNQDLFDGLDGYRVLDHSGNTSNLIVSVSENDPSGDYLFTNVPVDAFQIQIFVDGVASWDDIPVTAVTTRDGDGVMIDMTAYGSGRYIMVGWSVEDVTEDTFSNRDWIDPGPITYFAPPNEGETETYDDFDPSEDKFNFSAIEELTGFDQLAITLSDDGTGTIIDMSAVGHGTIILEGVLPEEILAKHFVGLSNDFLTQVTVEGTSHYVFNEDTIDSIAFNDIELDSDDFTLELRYDQIHRFEDIPMSYNEGDPGVLIDLTEFGGPQILLRGLQLEDVTADIFHDLISIPDGEEMQVGDNASKDMFTVEANEDATFIVDFHKFHDLIDLSEFDASFSDLVITAREDGKGSIIDLTDVGGGVIHLIGINPDEINQNFFNGLDGLTLNTDDRSITGSTDNDTIEASGGFSRLDGGEGDDTLISGSDAFSQTTMTGGEGADTFVFSPNSERSIGEITDFDPLEDIIDLSAFLDITDFSEISMAQDGNNVVLDLSDYGGGQIVVQNTTVDALTVDAFELHEETETTTEDVSA